MDWWHSHLWKAWSDIIVFNGNVYYQVRYCNTCNAAERRHV